MPDPILVTGSHRSGSTWVGRVLASAPRVVYVDEPFHPRHRLGICRAEVEHWYQYVTEENEDVGGWHTGLERTLDLRFALFRGLGDLRRPTDLARLVRDQGQFLAGRLRGARVLLKDPLAFFSAPWIARRFGARVLVLTRHPAAFASSLKRLGWNFDFRNWTSQPLLLRDRLEPWRAELEEAARDPGDVIDQAALCWRVLAGVTLAYQRDHSDWIFCRHEDLSLTPAERFRELATALELPFEGPMERYIATTTAGTNPSEAPPDRAHALQRDSRANVRNWTKRLDEDEVARLRDAVEPEAGEFYSTSDW